MKFFFSGDTFSVTIAVASDSDVAHDDDDANCCTDVAVVIVAAVDVVAVLI
jgi:hypothetical protein